MPFKIQRVPRGLNDLLSISGGQTPIELEERVRSVLDILQLYGQSQLQTGFVNNAASAEAAVTNLTLHATSWTVLFSVNCALVKTATLTALAGRISMNRRTEFGSLLFAENNLGPFGATETGTINFGGMLPYPVLCPPGTTVGAVPAIVGTDATVNISVFAEFGVLG